MKLYLVQHAQAIAKEIDPERPLSPEGVSDMHHMIKLLGKRKHPLCVSEVYHSNKLRARLTAEMLLKAIHSDRGLIEDRDLVPSADPDIWVHKLRERTEDLMLVGHMPHLKRLGERLLALPGAIHAPELTFVNGGVICLSRTEPGVWHKKWATTP